MELTYIQAAAEDAEQIFALSRELILRYEDPKEIDLDRALQWTRRKIRQNIARYTCVVCDGQKAGYFCFLPREGEMELDDLYILPQFRSRGIGTAVVRKCCDEADQPIFLYCFTKNVRALALYRRLGFEVSEAVGSTRCIMRREVL